MIDETRLRIGGEVTQLLRALEDSHDQTIRLSGQLVSLLPQARMEAGLSAVFGQGLFDHASEVLADLTQARRKIVGAHRSCEAAGRMIGYMGPPDQEKGPPNGQMPMEMQAPSPLRVVRSEEAA